MSLEHGIPSIITDLTADFGILNHPIAQELCDFTKSNLTASIQFKINGTFLPKIEKCKDFDSNCGSERIGQFIRPPFGDLTRSPIPSTTAEGAEYSEACGTGSNLVPHDQDQDQQRVGLQVDPSQCDPRYRHFHAERGEPEGPSIFTLQASESYIIYNLCLDALQFGQTGHIP